MIIKTQVFNPYIVEPGRLPVDRTGRPRQKSIDRSGRPTCTERARNLWLEADRPGRSTAKELLLSGMAPVDHPVDRQRAMLSVLCSGRPLGRPIREPLLFGSRPGRPGGRPVGSTVINVTVGRSTARSTGRAILPFACCQQADFVGATYTLFLELFYTSF